MARRKNKYSKGLTTMNQIDKVANWVIKKGYMVHYGRTDEVCRDSKIMTITSTMRNIHKLYTMLHESGHIMLYESPDYAKDYKDVEHGENGDLRHSNSLIFRYKKICEEIEAWRLGYELALKLGIRISKDRYDKYSAKYVMTYIKAVADTTSSYHKWGTAES